MVRRSGRAGATNKPKAAYLRLTLDRYGKKIGYEVQEEAILRWSSIAGVTIGRFYKDRDLTAADIEVVRPDFEEMLTDIGNGMWSGAVVWRLDRLVRLSMEFGRCERVIHGVGGSIVSVDPPLDSSDPFQKQMMYSIVGQAEIEITNMRTRAVGHRAERARRGLYNGGGPRPFGFLGSDLDLETGRNRNYGRTGVEHVPEEVDLLREAARRIAYEGWEYGDVLKDWASRDPAVLGTTGKPMQVTTLQKILTGYRVAGMRESSVYDPVADEDTVVLHKAIWDPILDEVTWNRLRAKMKRFPSQGPNEKYLFSGMCLCGRCMMPMTGTLRRYEKDGVMQATKTYRCKSDIGSKLKGSCGQMSVLAEPVERIAVARILARIEKTPELLREMVLNDARSDSTVFEATETMDKVDRRLVELAAARWSLDGGMSAKEWEAARVPLLRKRAEAEAVLASAAKASMGVPLPTDVQRKDLLKWFTNDLILTQQRSLVVAFISRVVVAPPSRGGRYFDKSRVKVELI